LIFGSAAAVLRILCVLLGVAAFIAGLFDGDAGLAAWTGFLTAPLAVDTFLLARVFLLDDFLLVDFLLVGFLLVAFLAVDVCFFLDADFFALAFFFVEPARFTVPVFFEAALAVFFLVLPRAGAFFVPDTDFAAAFLAAGFLLATFFFLVAAFFAGIVLASKTR
jgi:hypothetical protein